jgi:tetratricopeptide (TPR) repeat protein
MTLARDVPERPLPRPAASLEQGQVLEAAGQFLDAALAYDQAIEALGGGLEGLDTNDRRLLGLAWMNRGNALQKMATAVRWAEAVAAYDQAIAVFKTLPLEAEPRFRNHLGAAWMNRGHALTLLSDAAAGGSFKEAIAQLEMLPLEADPFYRLNLAGAWTNLAHVSLAPVSPAPRACSQAAARRALELVACAERTEKDFAAMSLRARRALVMALGDLLYAAERKGDSLDELTSEATDVIEDGMFIVRLFESRGIVMLRPLGARLFRLGAHLYGVHQPHFLGEFVLENLGAQTLAADAEFRAIATDAVANALARLHQPRPILAGTRDAEKLIATAQSLRSAQDQLLKIDAHFALVPSHS